MLCFYSNGAQKARPRRQIVQIFGGGVNAFSRYENGKTKPPLALVKLLRVLDWHPELLSVVVV
jgi:HTH-type transcriptional regulator / antitoxin MqsA